MKVGIILILFALLVGCGDAQTNAFNAKAHLMTDIDGRKYLIKHHVGGVYVVIPVEDKP